MLVFDSTNGVIYNNSEQNLMVVGYAGSTRVINHLLKPHSAHKLSKNPDSISVYKTNYVTETKSFNRTKTFYAKFDDGGAFGAASYKDFKPENSGSWYPDHEWSWGVRLKTMTWVISYSETVTNSFNYCDNQKFSWNDKMSYSGTGDHRRYNTGAAGWGTNHDLSKTLTSNTVKHSISYYKAIDSSKQVVNPNCSIFIK